MPVIEVGTVPLVPKGDQVPGFAVSVYPNLVVPVKARLRPFWPWITGWTADNEGIRYLLS